MSNSRPGEGIAVAAPPGIIVFVHGYLDSAEVWARSIERLSLPGWRSEAVSLQAANMPLASSEELLERYAQQVLERAVGISSPASPVVIVGHSMGGQIAELLASRLGGRVAGLVLVTPVPLCGYPLPPAVMDRFTSRVGLTDVAAIKEGKRSLAVALDDEALDILAYATIATSHDAALEQLRAWTGGHPAGKRLSQVEAPVLTIATDDKFLTAEMLAQGTTRFRASSLEKIDGAGHWPQLEQSEALAREITRFVLSLPQT